VAGLLLPGRLQGVLWRSFFRGRHAVAEGRYQAAGAHFEEFLQQLRDTPSRRHAIFLAWSIYTWNAEAMTRNNLGVSHLFNGRLDDSERELGRALALDAHYPMPLFNLGILAHARGQHQRAEELRSAAASLGYRGATRDKLISAGGAALAAFEGRL
jgi:tetratricopeptide (TPR) repeat protein